MSMLRVEVCGRVYAVSDPVSEHIVLPRSEYARLERIVSRRLVRTREGNHMVVRKQSWREQDELKIVLRLATPPDERWRLGYDVDL